MIIPKSTTSSLPIYVSAIGACGSTVWNLTVSCPEPLPSFVSSDRYAIPTIPCEEAKNNTYYFAKVHTAADTYVGINDFVFSDINGEFPLTDGYYLISNVAAPLKVMGVTNGIVVAFTNCS